MANNGFRPDPNDIIILVMGPTRTGKTNFINTLTGNIEGHRARLRSDTQRIAPHRIMTGQGDRVVLVDVPGFDDTYWPDTEILRIIADWVTQKYPDGGTLYIGGIVYLHRITDNRMSGSVLKNLEMFHRLCGDSYLPRVRIVTTMWDKVENISTAESRERELMGEFWRDLISEGAVHIRFNNTRTCAWNIVHELTRMGRNGDLLLLQEELLQQNKRLNETEAAKVLYKRLQQLLAEQKKTLKELADEAAYTQDNSLAGRMREEYDRMNTQSQRTLAEINEMKIPISRRIYLQSGMYKIDPSYIPTRLASINSKVHRDSRVTGEDETLNKTIRAFRVQDKNSNATIARLEKTVQELRDELTTSRLEATRDKDALNKTIQNSNTKVADLEKASQSLRDELVAFQLAITRDKDALNETIQNSNTKIALLENTNLQLTAQLANSHESLVQIHDAHQKKHQCEALYAEGHIIDASACLLEMSKTISEKARTNKLIMEWLSEFTGRCIMTLERFGDEASNAKKWSEATAAYSSALLLSPSIPHAILIKWAKMTWSRSTVSEMFKTAIKFRFPRFVVYQTICNILEEDGHIAEAIKYFRQMKSERADDMNTPDERAQWELGFRRRCVEKLEKLGDAAMDSQNHDAAIKNYSDALTLDPAHSADILLKQSKVRALMGSWEEALIDADKAIELDPSSYKGYERKHAALQGAGQHIEATKVFKLMLLKLDQSLDPSIRELRRQYVDAPSTIRGIIQQTILTMPRVLINTTTGQLCDKTRLAAAFEQLPIYDELVSSMTTELDNARIRKEVETFYRYVTFSHKWEDGEPLFQRVENILVYDLDVSSPNIKLQTLCRLANSLGFQWVWSDTCCIDKKDNVILQESLVAMFAWYRGSSLTIVYLRGVWSESQQPGDLQKSIWNTRAWTYQEYVAAEIVQFYTEDWKPYLGLNMFNHKKSPAVISEMEQVSGISAQRLDMLRPGSERIREKLFLASTRHTTLVEDIAYSLLGIFNVPIPIIYGEGNRAVGRLLDHILTSSGDVTILAWIGHAGSYNSCLPPDLTVYMQLVPPHYPLSINTTEMDSVVATLHSSLPSSSLAVDLHNLLHGLSSPSFVASRLRLPGIVFPVTKLVDTTSNSHSNGVRVYNAKTAMLWDVEIQTKDDLSGWMQDLVLIHPWISVLLDQEFSHGKVAFDDITRALRLVARLRQPFGALLLALVSHKQYRRVAADCLIRVQIREEASLTELIGCVGTVDIL